MDIEDNRTLARPTPRRAPRARFNPVDLSPLAEVPQTSPEELRAMVASARRASEHWRVRPLKERAAILRRAAKAMLRNSSAVESLVRQEVGKVAAEVLFNETIGHVDVLNSWVPVVAAAASRRRVRISPLKFPGKRAHIDPVPRGVIGVIAPWNFPIAGLYRSLYPALLTGNGVIVKPSEHSPRSSAWFAEQLAAALPEGLVAVAHGAGDVGAQLLDSGIDACVFTGSPEAGRTVRVRCAELGIPCSAEMGGKDAAIVLEDCDLARTCAGITHWALSNAGQACGAIEVVYAEDAIADKLVSALADSWRRLRARATEPAEVAPVAYREQLELVMRHVDEARAAGARVLCGGAPTGNGLFYPPTLLDNCNETMSVVRDETFGPVLAVVRVASAAEAVRHVNRGRYGLTASIWTRDTTRAHKLAEQLAVGVVTINNHAVTGAMPELPWSGTRDSGHGIANGREALGTFIRPRVVLTDRSSAPEAFWMPFDNDLLTLGALLRDAQLGKLAQAWRIPVLMRRRVAAIRRFFSGAVLNGD